MSDDRINQLIAHLTGDGFANNMVWQDELRDAMTELRRHREKPLHCPCCDGDHL